MSFTYTVLTACFFFLQAEVLCRHREHCFRDSDCSASSCCYLARKGKRSTHEGRTEMTLPFNTCIPHGGEGKGCHGFLNGKQGCPRCKSGHFCKLTDLYNPPYGFVGTCRRLYV